jgi:hypothetical protein
VLLAILIVGMGFVLLLVGDCGFIGSNVLVVENNELSGDCVKVAGSKSKVEIIN